MKDCLSLLTLVLLGNPPKAPAPVSLAQVASSSPFAKFLARRAPSPYREPLSSAAIDALRRSAAKSVVVHALEGVVRPALTGVTLRRIVKGKSVEVALIDASPSRPPIAIPLECVQYMSTQEGPCPKGMVRLSVLAFPFLSSKRFVELQPTYGMLYSYSQAFTSVYVPVGTVLEGIGKDKRRERWNLVAPAQGKISSFRFETSLWWLVPSVVRTMPLDVNIQQLRAKRIYWK